LIIPKNHIRNLDELTQESLTKIFTYAQKREKGLRHMGYTGICFRINTGTTQDVPHLHIHIWGEVK